MDAKNFLFQKYKHRDVFSFLEANHPTTFVDIIILNKFELVFSQTSKDTFGKLEKEIHVINSLAHII